ncbi:MAG: DJ-1/PfpI family protein [Nitrospirae bacterium]|nr:DJ-1/PfpI family protein [Nitrospirota bacterium]
MKDVGAIYEDKEVVVDGNLITSRQPSDLPAFLRETMGLNCNIFRSMRR